MIERSRRLGPDVDHVGNDANQEIAVRAPLSVPVERPSPPRERAPRAAPRLPAILRRGRLLGGPLVSAVIPTYDRAHLVASAIDSVLAQRDVAVECIVVDDGSTDGTDAVLAGYGDAIRVIRSENRGPSVARNLGAAAARGRWLAFLDSDDRWEPDKLGAQLDAVGDGVFVYTDHAAMGKVRPGEERFSDVVDLHDGDVFEPLVLQNFITLSSVMVRKEAFVTAGGFCPDLPCSEDWDLWLRLAAQHPVTLVDRPLTYYRRHAAGISKDLERMAGTQLRVVSRALRLPRARRLPRRTAWLARARALEHTAVQMSPRRPCRAVVWYLASLSMWPRRPTTLRVMASYLLRRHG